MAALAVGAACAGLAACDRTGAPSLLPAPKAPAAVAGYLTPPAVTASAPGAGGATVLSGTAAPRARVRLGSPGGEAKLATTDDKGAWRIALPPSAEARIFGLSMTTAGRQTQGQGYVLVTPGSRVVLLRSGAGALEPPVGGPPRITAFDYDREGGSIISGFAPAGALVSIRIDGRPTGESRADAAGRFALALAQPIAQGRHTIQILGDSFENSATIEATPAPPLAGGPFRAQTTDYGLRADWMTPGGGVQSTLIMN